MLCLLCQTFTRQEQSQSLVPSLKANRCSVTLRVHQICTKPQKRLDRNRKMVRLSSKCRPNAYIEMITRMEVEEDRLVTHIVLALRPPAYVPDNVGNVFGGIHRIHNSPQDPSVPSLFLLVIRHKHATSCSPHTAALTVRELRTSLVLV